MDQPALLGRGLPRRRLPLRPRHHRSGARTHGFDPGSGFFDAIRQDPMLSAREADLRALGHRPGRLPARQPPAGLRRMERPLPRRRPPLLARRQRPARGPRRAPRGLGRPLRPARRGGPGPRQLRRQPRRLHAADAVRLRRSATTRPTARTTATATATTLSHNWGVEGPTDDPAIRATRASACSARCSPPLFLAQGTPMLLAGDEFGRTQNGNNNAYCQDNEISWVDWSRAERRRRRRCSRFVARLHRAAARHAAAALRASSCTAATAGARRSATSPGSTSTAQTISAEAWNDPEERTLALRRAAARDRRQRAI